MALVLRERHNVAWLQQIRGKVLLLADQELLVKGCVAFHSDISDLQRKGPLLQNDPLMTRIDWIITTSTGAFSKKIPILCPDSPKTAISK